MERIHPRGEKGEVGSSVRGVDIGFIGEEDRGTENIRGGRYGRSVGVSDGKNEWVRSFSLGMRRGKFGSPIVIWDYNREKGKKLCENE